MKKMARRKDLIRKELFINGVRVRFGMKRTGFPTQIMIDELIDYFYHGTPWSGHFITEYKPDVRPNYIGHHFKMISREAPIG